MRLLAYWLLLLLIIAIPCENLIFIESIGTISKAIGVAVAICWIVTIGAEASIRTPRLFHVAAFAFVVWNAFTCFWSKQLQTTVLDVFTLVQLVGLVMIAWDLLRTEAQLRGAMQAYVIGAFAALGSLMANYFAGIGTPMQRYSATDFDPNLIAAILAMGIPLAWQLATTRRHLFARLINYCYIPSAVGGIVLTASRGGVIASLPAMAYVLLSASNRYRIPKWAIAMLFVGVLAAIPWIAPEKSVERLSTIQSSIAEADLGGRVATWRESLPMFLERPLLGYGTGAFDFEHPRKAAPHNIFVSVLIETGFIGFLLLIFLLIVTFRDTVRQQRNYAWLWLSVLLVLGLAAVVGNLEHRKQTWLILGLVTVSAYLPQRQTNIQRRRTPGIEPPPRRLPILPVATHS